MTAPAIRQLLGAVLARGGHLGEAEQQYTLAAQLEPGNANGYVHLGFFYALSCPGRSADAIEAFEKAIGLDPEARDLLKEEKHLVELRRDHRFMALLAGESDPGRGASRAQAKDLDARL